MIILSKWMRRTFSLGEAKRWTASLGGEGDDKKFN